MSELSLKDETAATKTIAVVFFALVGYFLVDAHIVLKEYYASSPPYATFAVCALVVAAAGFLLLSRIEPQRSNSHVYAILLAIATGLASYPAIARINIVTDQNGLHTYEYVLGNDYVWRTSAPDLPEVHLYQRSSDYWRTFSPGDEYQFDLRQGGLGIWLVNMERIYEEQQEFYDCYGLWECMFVF